MEFGIPALVEVPDIREAAALCRELGLSFVELNTNFPTQQLHLLDAEELTSLSRRYGISYTIHLNDEMPVADFNPVVAKGYLDAVLEAICFAKKIGAMKLNMHLSDGARYTMPDRRIFFYEAYQEEYLAGITRFRDVCTEAIGDADLMICIENSGGFRPFHLAALDALLESPVFGLTLDVGHDHCTGGSDGNWILQHRDRLHHMHIHDARGCQDHLPPGSGEIDLKKWLTFGQELNCTAVLEIKTLPGLRQGAAWAQEAGF